jgi:hypothetical protein
VIQFRINYSFPGIQGFQPPMVLQTALIKDVTGMAGLADIAIMQEDIHTVQGHGQKLW